MDRKAVRQSIGFAKRNAQSSKLSRKIGWLNSHGNLLEEIRFSDVKDLLHRTGEDEAMMILQNLEKKAREIQHPTNYIISAARNSLEGGRKPKGRPRKGRAPQGKKGEGRGEEPAEDGQDAEMQDGNVPEPDEERDEAKSSQVDSADTAKVEDQMRLLNASVSLNQELDVEKALEPLVSLGVDSAMEILSHLEEKASEVRDPTAYVIKAARQRGKGKSRAREDRRNKGVIKTHLKEKPGSFDPAMVEKVKKRINWLNDRGRLNDTLSYDKVGEMLLSSGPISEVMKIFKTLEENAAEVRNPNAYITTAARRLSEEGVAPEPKSSVGRSQDFRNEPLDKQLRAHITWLNREVALNAVLDYDQVSRPLLSIETREAGEILRRLEESAKEVRDPNGYVIKAAQRILSDQGGGKAAYGGGGQGGGGGGGYGGGGGGGGGGSYGGGSYSGGGSYGGGGGHGAGSSYGGDRRKVPEPPLPPRPSADADKIAKRVHWLNGHAKLAAPLDYDRLAPSFRSLGYYQSLEVLNNLEENAATVRDPTAYVMVGIRKIGGGDAGKGGQQHPPPPAMPALPAPPPKGSGRGGEEKLRRKIEWLNRNVCNEPMQTERVLTTLTTLHTQQAFDVLKNFEENSATVRDPTGYIIGTARKAEKGETIGTAPSRKVPEPYSRGKGGDRRPEPIGSFAGRPREAAPGPSRGAGDHLRRYVDWLNTEAGLQTDLDAERVLPQLSRVSDQDATDILKRLEESAGSVRDPTAYVISAIRRTVGGKGKGRSK